MRTRTYKTGDDRPAINDQLTDLDGNTVDLTDAQSVKFVLQSKQAFSNGSDSLTVNATAEVVDAPNGVVEYELRDSDLDVEPGRYLGCWVVSWPDANGDGKADTQHFPRSGLLEIDVQDAISGSVDAESAPTDLTVMRLTADELAGTVADGNVITNLVGDGHYVDMNGHLNVSETVGGGYNYVQDSEPSSPSEGEEWYDTGENEAYVYDGTSWLRLTLVDHGALAGLGDDDHPQYATDTRLDGHIADAGAHHSRYSDSEARSACDGQIDAATLDGQDASDFSTSDSDIRQAIAENTLQPDTATTPSGEYAQEWVTWKSGLGANFSWSTMEFSAHVTGSRQLEAIRVTGVNGSSFTIGSTGSPLIDSNLITALQESNPGIDGVDKIELYINSGSPTTKVQIHLCRFH